MENDLSLIIDDWTVLGEGKGSQRHVERNDDANHGNIGHRKSMIVATSTLNYNRGYRKKEIRLPMTEGHKTWFAV